MDLDPPVLPPNPITHGWILIYGVKSGGVISPTVMCVNVAGLLLQNNWAIVTERRSLKRATWWIRDGRAVRKKYRTPL